MRAKIRGFCEVVNSGIHPIQNLKVLEKVEKDYGESRKNWAVFWLQQGLNTLEGLIQQQNKGGKYVFGDDVTGADVFLFPQVYNAKVRYGIDIKEYPNVFRIF